MSLLLKVLLWIVLGWLVVVFALRRVAIHWRARTRRNAQSLLEGQRVLIRTDEAVLAGSDLEGMVIPNRVSGTLALTDRGLYFLPWFGHGPLALPRILILDADTDVGFTPLATPANPCLVLSVSREGGGFGRIGWIVREPWRWREEIQRLVGKIP